MPFKMNEFFVPWAIYFWLRKSEKQSDLFAGCFQKERDHGMSPSTDSANKAHHHDRLNWPELCVLEPEEPGRSLPLLNTRPRNPEPVKTPDIMRSFSLRSNTSWDQKLISSNHFVSPQAPLLHSIFVLRTAGHLTVTLSECLCPASSGPSNYINYSISPSNKNCKCNSKPPSTAILRNTYY